MTKETRINGNSGEQVRVYAPGEGMRVYAPSNGTLAYRQDYAYRTAQVAEPRRRPEPAHVPQQRPDRKKQGKQHISVLQMIRQNRVFLKLIAIGCIIAVAAVAAFAVIRFTDIANIQAEINELNEQIAQTERSITGLSFTSQPVLNATEFARSVGLVPARP